MAITIYRVCRRIYASLDGEGSRKVGGRWNSPDRQIVYMARSVGSRGVRELGAYVAPGLPNRLCSSGGDRP